MDSKYLCTWTFYAIWHMPVGNCTNFVNLICLPYLKYFDVIILGVEWYILSMYPWRWYVCSILMYLWHSWCLCGILITMLYKVLWYLCGILDVLVHLFLIFHCHLIWIIYFGSSLRFGNDFISCLIILLWFVNMDIIDLSFLRPH